MLLEAGANDHMLCGRFKVTPVWAAFGKKHYGLVQQLVVASGNLGVLDAGGMSLLHGAVATANLDAVRKLITLGANLNARDTHDITALMRTGQDLRYGGKIVQVLLDAGADWSIVEPTGQTALVGCARLGNAEVAQLLLKAGARTTDKVDGWTSLLTASLEGHADVLDARTDTTVRVEDRMSLMLAAQNGHSKVIDHLLQARARVNTRNADGRTALVCAIEERRTEAVRILCKAGANPRAALTGLTVLFMAVDLGYVEIARTLVKAGADVNDGPNEFKPLFKACREQQLTIVRELLRAGANPVDDKVNGLSVLHVAAGRSFPEVARVCLEERCL